MLSRVCRCMNRRFWLNKISASLETKVNKLLLFNNRVYKCMQDFSLGTFSFANKTNRKKLLIGRKVLQQNIWVTLGEEMAKKLVGCIWWFDDLMHLMWLSGCRFDPCTTTKASRNILETRISYWQNWFGIVEWQNENRPMLIPCDVYNLFWWQKTGQRCTKITGALVRMQN